jgi:hypothetical protein
MAASDAASAVVAGMAQQADESGMVVGDDAKEFIEANKPPEPEEPAAEEAPLIPPPEEPAAESSPEAPEETPEDVGTAFKPVPEEEIAEYEDEDLEPVAEVDDPDPADADDPYEDEDAIKRRLFKAEKALAHERSLRVAQNAKRWSGEASERYPLASLGTIQASSKRDFLRQAALSHNANYELLAPHIEKLEAAKRSLKEAALAEARAEAQANWGTPTVGPGTADTEAAANEAALIEARKTGDLSKIIGALRRGAGGGE